MYNLINKLLNNIIKIIIFQIELSISKLKISLSNYEIFALLLKR